MALLEPVRLRVERLGRRGEGVASLGGRAVYIPYALPGETILADIDGERGHLRSVVEPRADRLTPFCPYYGRCGGCAVQTLPPEPYRVWKRDLLAAALRQAGIMAEVAPLLDAHGGGRRRVTFHARFGPGRDECALGFMAARSHDIVDIVACPILVPALTPSAEHARRIAEALRPAGKPLDILVTATDAGLDMDLRGCGRLDEVLTRRLVKAAGEAGLARLSNHGETLVEAEAPTLRVGSATLMLPPGAFLQATAAGEAALTELVLRGIGPARRIADLFCGIGTFALPLARVARVSAWDSEAKAIAALDRAARSTPDLHPLVAGVRDLVRRPLLAAELEGFEAVVFDPPRAGAAAQSAELAGSSVPTIVAVSCDPGTLARDLAVLLAGGYAIESVTPVDQFRFAAHIEAVAVLRRRVAKTRKRRLLS